MTKADLLLTLLGGLVCQARRMTIEPPHSGGLNQHNLIWNLESANPKFGSSVTFNGSLVNIADGTTLTFGAGSAINGAVLTDGSVVSSGAMHLNFWPFTAAPADPSVSPCFVGRFPQNDLSGPHLVRPACEERLGQTHSGALVIRGRFRSKIEAASLLRYARAGVRENKLARMAGEVGRTAYQSMHSITGGWSTGRLQVVRRGRSGIVTLALEKNLPSLPLA